jgi:hypothetical protein
MVVKLPTLHLVGIFHTVSSQAFSHCAFTGKALRFPRMMQEQGYEVVEYSNEGSEAGASEHVQILSTEERDALFPSGGLGQFYGDHAVVGCEGHVLFSERLELELRGRLEPGDIICHPFGHAHEALLTAFPNHRHVETGIGYPTTMQGSIHVYESYAWMHYHAGKDGRPGRNYDFVIPNYFDLSEWEPRGGKGGEYLAFLGRICSIKGMDTIREIADRSSLPVHIAGQGNPNQWAHPNIVYRGVITGTERSEFLSRAQALLAPSIFIEPFCGMAVEAQLCGTPVVSVNYGALTETVVQGVSGFRCHTLRDWMEGIEAAGYLDRDVIVERARSLYSLEACGQQYCRMFRAVEGLSGEGWYSMGDDAITSTVTSAFIEATDEASAPSPLVECFSR